jgi:hypothetical protein
MFGGGASNQTTRVQLIHNLDGRIQDSVILDVGNTHFLSPWLMALKVFIA